MSVSDAVHSMGKLLQLMFCVHGKIVTTVYVLCAWAHCYDSLCSVCMGKIVTTTYVLCAWANCYDSLCSVCMGKIVMTAYVLCAWANCYDSLCSVCMGKIVTTTYVLCAWANCYDSLCSVCMGKIVMTAYVLCAWANCYDSLCSVCMGKLLWQLMFCVHGQNCYDSLCSVCMGKLLWQFMFCVHHHWGGRAQLVECWTKEPGAILTRGLISQCGKEFVSWSQLSVQTLTMFAQLPCAVACVNIRMHALSKPWYLPPFLWGRRSWTDAGSLVRALKTPALSAIPLFERTKTLHTLVGVGSAALVVAVALPR